MLNELLTCLLKLLKRLFKYPFEVIKSVWKQVVNCCGSETASRRELREDTRLFGERYHSGQLDGIGGARMLHLEPRSDNHWSR